MIVNVLNSLINKRDKPLRQQLAIFPKYYDKVQIQYSSAKVFRSPRENFTLDCNGDDYSPDDIYSSKYLNIHQIPKMKKIVINRGLGNVGQTPKMVHAPLLEIATITGQHGIVTRARHSVAGFKIRENIVVGIIVTIRGRRITAFWDRLVNLALPRIRDFQGLSRGSFDRGGNYSIGLEEQLIFPEIPYEQIDQICGIDISIVTSAQRNRDRIHLLQTHGIPFSTV